MRWQRGGKTLLQGLGSGGNLRNSSDATPDIQPVPGANGVQSGSNDSTTAAQEFGWS